MTLDFFERQMARLSGLRFRPADLQTHWEGLQGLPDDVLEAAIGHAVVARVDFPTPRELRQDADIVVRQTRVIEPVEDRSTPIEEPYEIQYPQGAATIQVRSEWSYYCERCSDGGWQSLWCGAFTAARKPWQEPRVCDRRGPHDSHEWTRPCACWDTNPALKRKREAQQKYADQAVKK